MVKSIFSRKDADTLAEALKIFGVQVRWNLRKQIAEIKRGQDKWKPINDRLESVVLYTYRKTKFFCIYIESSVH